MTPEQGSLGTTALALPPLKLPALPSLPSRSLADHERYIIELREVMRCRERLLEARERILVSHADGLQRQLTAALARIAANDNALSWIGGLLAVMHADGGHYLAKHGMEKSIGDAMDKYHAMHQRIAELEAALDAVIIRTDCTSWGMGYDIWKIASAARGKD